MTAGQSKARLMAAGWRARVTARGPPASAAPRLPWMAPASRFSKNELTDDVTASQRSRAALTPPAYPEIRRPSPVRSRRPLNSSTASNAIVRKRMGCRKG